MKSPIGKRVSVTRYVITAMPESPEWDRARFVPIREASEFRESTGFTPLEGSEIAPIDAELMVVMWERETRSPCKVAIKRHFEEQMKIAERLGPVGTQDQARMKKAAELDVLKTTSPKTKLIPVVLCRGYAYLLTTGKKAVSGILADLQKAGIECARLHPVIDGFDGEVDADSWVADDFLQAMEARGELTFHSKICTSKVGEKATFEGDHISTVNAALDQGHRITKAKLVHLETSYMFDSVAWTFSSLPIEQSFEDAKHWHDTLGFQVEAIEHFFACFDRMAEQFNASRSEDAHEHHAGAAQPVEAGDYSSQGGEHVEPVKPGVRNDMFFKLGGPKPRAAPPPA